MAADPGPLPIRPLDQSLINRIAAGEIITRPVSALKEILENALDAGATSIRVTVKDGGLKLLQIQDNGCGIRNVDLPILAERFTTSKLSTFSDLSRLSTYGFRGEALASISHVSRLSVVTKTKTEGHAWKASYLNGCLSAQKPGEAPEPKPCAGNNGTTITIEDLFYNIPTRLSALRNTSEEYARILDLLTRYAVHNPKVSFSCKKIGSPSPDLSTPSSETIHVIRLLYGHSVTKELLEEKLSSKGLQKEHIGDSAEILQSEEWAVEALFTNPNHQAKKMTFLLFINHRLVESARMKRAVESVYNAILPKGMFPFVYLSLMIDPRAVDVNVHPTKREVHFLNEDTIIEAISSALSCKLASHGQSRAFEYQQLLTGGVAGSESLNSKSREGKAKDAGQNPTESNSLSNKSRKGKAKDTGQSPPVDETASTGENQGKIYSHNKVRTSGQDRTLDSMFPVVNPARVEPHRLASRDADVTPSTQPKDIKESDCSLSSIKSLRHNLVKGRHSYLSEMMEKHTFVGIVSLDHCLSLIQHSTKLYLVNHARLAEELFYQLGLRQFGDINRLRLEPPPSLRSLIEIAVQAEESAKSCGMGTAQIVDRIVCLLTSKREMLSEYFSLDISESGMVETLPLLLREYTPNLDNLPNFLMRLGPQVEWESETECFDTFLRELAFFYGAGSPLTESEEAQIKAERWQIQHVLFPAARRYLLGPKSLLDRDIILIANLPDLYKVFERC